MYLVNMGPCCTACTNMVCVCMNSTHLVRYGLTVLVDVNCTHDGSKSAKSRKLQQQPPASSNAGAASHGNWASVQAALAPMAVHDPQQHLDLIGKAQDPYILSLQDAQRHASGQPDPFSALVASRDASNAKVRYSCAATEMVCVCMYISHLGRCCTAATNMGRYGTASTHMVFIFMHIRHLVRYCTTSTGMV